MIRYLPTRILEKLKLKKKAKGLVTNDLNLNRTALRTLNATGVFKKKALENTALEVIKGYKKRYGKERKAGASVAEATKEALQGRRNMVARIENEAIFQIHKGIRTEYRGEYYEWLPSDAEEPDPEHQLKYGERFQVGVGEMPGDRYGCRCGMNILVDETELELTGE